MQIADRIRAWRHALGLTQEEFADRAGIPKRTLVGYENAEREPGAAALAAIAKTGVNMTWLLTGEGEMRPQASVGADTALKRESPYARRWEKIMALVDGIEDDAARAAAIEELFARAQSAAEMAELRRAVKDLTATLKRA